MHEHLIEQEFLDFVQGHRRDERLFTAEVDGKKTTAAQMTAGKLAGWARTIVKDPDVATAARSRLLIGRHGPRAVRKQAAKIAARHRAIGIDQEHGQIVKQRPNRSALAAVLSDQIIDLALDFRGRIGVFLPFC